MSRKFYTLDVFTSCALSGNPLAVVLDSDGLSLEDMQQIAAEFNLSETVFVSEPKNKNHLASIRIFTPAHELPFAGHPTVGTAILMSDLNNIPSGSNFILEEQVGPVVCSISNSQSNKTAKFQTPKIPEPFEWNIDAATLSNALGLHESDIGYGSHQPSGWDAGVPYILVPVSSLDAMQRITVDPVKSMEIEPVINGINANIYAYCAGGESSDASFHSRMFAHSSGIPEDPATGSALASLCGQIASVEMSSDSNQTFMIEQGYEMGRPSQLYLEVHKENDFVSKAFISGSAVIISEGILHV